MTWAPGELERVQLFFEQRQGRIDTRIALESAMLAPPEPLRALEAGYVALVRDAAQRHLPAENDAIDFPDSPVIVNQDLY